MIYYKISNNKGGDHPFRCVDTVKSTNKPLGDEGYHYIAEDIYMDPLYQRRSPHTHGQITRFKLKQFVDKLD
jgi:hypothetical protein